MTTSEQFLPKTIPYRLGGEWIEIEVKPNLAVITQRYQTQDDPISSVSTGNTLHERNLIHENSLIQQYAIEFDQELTLDFFEATKETSGIINSGIVYHFQGNDFYGNGGIVLITKEEQNAVFIKEHTGRKVIKETGKRVFLIYFESELDALDFVNDHKEHPPEWLEHVDTNWFSFHATKEFEDPVMYKGNLDFPYSYPFPHSCLGLHNLTKLRPGCPNIKVAILDTGIDNGHPSLNDACVKEMGYDYVNDSNQVNPKTDQLNAHGTKCAGVIAARPFKKVDFRGIASGVSIIDYRIGYVQQSEEFRLELFDLIAAFYQAAIIDGAQIINCSWNHTMKKESLEYILDFITSDKNPHSPCIIVAGAGNDELCLDTRHLVPTKHKKVVTVAALDSKSGPCVKNENRKWGSNFGDCLDVATIGEGITTTTLRQESTSGSIIGFTNQFNGTSAATAVLSGIIALMLSQDKTLDLQKIKKLLKGNLVKQDDRYYGALVINVKKILNTINQNS